MLRRFLFCRSACSHLRILKSSCIYFAVVLGCGSLITFYVPFLLTQSCYNFNCLMAISMTLCLGFVTHLSLLYNAWCQATLPLSLGGLSLHKVSCVSSATFIGSCLSSQSLCTQLLPYFQGYVPSIPPIPGMKSASVYLSSLTGSPLPVVDNPSKAQHIFQYSVDLHCYSSLLDYVTLQDQARIRGIFHHFCASAWLQAKGMSVPLGLTLPAHEFMVALWFWLYSIILTVTWE